MQLALALLSGAALIASTVAVPEPNAASFTTWSCANCARDQNCPQINHQNVRSETCLRLEAGQQSIIVDFTVRPSCVIKTYASTDCTGDGPTYGFEPERNCKPIVAPESTSYQVLC